MAALIKLQDLVNLRFYKKSKSGFLLWSSMSELIKFSLYKIFSDASELLSSGKNEILESI